MTTEIKMKEILEAALKLEGNDFFRVVYDGSIYAANKKTKKPARATIMLPPKICNDDIKLLDEWVIIATAIPLSNASKIIEKIWEKKQLLKKEGPNKKQEAINH